MDWLLFSKFAPRGGVFGLRSASVRAEHPPDVQRRQLQASLRLGLHFVAVRPEQASTGRLGPLRTRE